jgi:hypothetical protein
MDFLYFYHNFLVIINLNERQFSLLTITKIKMSMSFWLAPSNERHSYFLCGAYDFSRGQLPHFMTKMEE